MMVQGRRHRSKGAQKNTNEIKQLHEKSKQIDGDFQSLFKLLMEESKLDEQANSMRTLLVIRDKELEKQYNEILTKRGHTVVSCLPEEVLEQHHKEPFSMMILEESASTTNKTADPVSTEKEEINAIELCRHIRNVVFEYVVILIITKEEGIDDVNRILDAGANDYLFYSFSAAIVEVRLMCYERQVLESIKLKQTEELKLVLKRLVLCVEKCNDSVEIWDRQGRIQYLNQMVQQRTGYKRWEFLGKEFKMFLVNAEIYNSLWETICTGKVWTGTMVTRHDDGNSYQYDSIVSPITNHVEEIICYFVIKRDMRDRQVKQEEVKREIEKAREKERIRLNFMSHDIRTLMSEIIGLSDMLGETELSPKQKEFMTQITKSSNNLMNILRDMLDIFKIESGKLKVENTAFNILTELEDVVDVLTEQAEEKGIELSAFIHPDVLPIKLVGDPQRLKQVFTNLIGNAVKFTKVGEVSASIYLLEETHDMVMLKLEVKDTGVGIKKELLSKLFDTAEATADESRAYGRGLGLQLSKDIVHAVFQGEIGVESEIDKGSVFWCTLKLNRKVEEEPESTPAQTDSGSAPAASVPGELAVNPAGNLAGRRVLLCTKNHTTQQMVISLLKKFVTDVDVIDSAARIIPQLKEAKAEQKNYSVLFFDYTLPEVNSSHQVFKEIRASEGRGKLVSFLFAPVKVVKEKTDWLNEAKKFGLNAVIAKPIKQSKFLEVVRETVSGSQLNEQPKKKPTAEAPPPAAAPVLKVLVVDDNKVNRQSAIRMIERLGYQTSSAENGSEAVEAFEMGAWSLILMDCEMPVKDGFQATREIRKIEETEFRKRTPIVALTAHAFAEDQQKCFDSGMDDYLSKPMKLKEIQDRMTKWIPKSTSE